MRTKRTDESEKLGTPKRSAARSVESVAQWERLVGHVHAVRLVRMHRIIRIGLVQLGVFLFLDILWMSMFARTAGATTVASVSIVLIAASLSTFCVGAVQLVMIQCEVTGYLRVHGLNIRQRHGVDLRSAEVFDAWCLREGISPEQVAGIG